MRIPDNLENDPRVRTFHRTAARYPNVYAAARQILRDYGNVPFDTIGADLRGDDWRAREFIEVLRGLTTHYPTNPANYLFEVFSSAQSWFAASDCILPCHEDGLTALFKRRVDDAVHRLNSHIRACEPERDLPPIFGAHLNILAREYTTGGDIAFIFGLTDSDGQIGYLVHCFQAKRANEDRDAPVNIRRDYDATNQKDGGNQLRRLARLSKLGCRCSYLFYNNDKNRLISQPVAPIVKSIDHILQRGDAALDVLLNSDCCDVASMVLRSTSADVYSEFFLDEDRLREVISALVAEDISHFVTFGTDRTAFHNILTFARDSNLINLERKRPLGTDAINFDLVARATDIDWYVEIEDAAQVPAMTFSGRRGKKI